MSSLIALQHIVKKQPQLNEFEVSLKSISPSEFSVQDAVVSVVIGQMLSREAAFKIRSRVFEKAKLKGKHSPAELNQEELRSCGLSNNKVKAIKLFHEKYRENSHKYEKWKTMNTEKLFQAVQAEWGLSKWSASILAIFYFGMEDIYPVGDGTLIRAENRLNDIGISIDPSKASPYKSYLALFMWALIDEGHI